MKNAISTFFDQRSNGAIGLYYYSRHGFRSHRFILATIRRGTLRQNGMWSPFCFMLPDSITASASPNPFGLSHLAYLLVTHFYALCDW